MILKKENTNGVKTPITLLVFLLFGFTAIVIFKYSNIALLKLTIIFFLLANLSKIPRWIK
jgi:hypothetical protein